MNDVKLQDFVNSSGFPLQIGIQNHIEKTSADHGWKVLLKEFPWRNLETGNDGFVDLVLRNQYDTLTVILECKRVRDTNWIFLEPSTKSAERRHGTFWLTCVENENTKDFGWYDAALDPTSSESEFCVVPGQDPKSKPMLERTAAELLEATEAIAFEEYQLHKNDKTNLRFFYFPVIATTAELQICTFSPDDISIERGELQKSKFRKAPFVRLRKSLTTKQQSYSGPKDIREIARDKERTVFVVNSANLVYFIQNLEAPGSPATTYRRLSGP